MASQSPLFAAIVIFTAISIVALAISLRRTVSDSLERDAYYVGPGPLINTSSPKLVDPPTQKLEPQNSTAPTKSRGSSATQHRRRGTKEIRLVDVSSAFSPFEATGSFFPK